LGQGRGVQGGEKSRLKKLTIGEKVECPSIKYALTVLRTPKLNHEKPPSTGAGKELEERTQQQMVSAEKKLLTVSIMGKSRWRRVFFYNGAFKNKRT